VDLHPALLTLCSLLGSLIFPSLPAEVSILSLRSPEALISPHFS